VGASIDGRRVRATAGSCRKCPRRGVAAQRPLDGSRTGLAEAPQDRESGVHAQGADPRPPPEASSFGGSVARSSATPRDRTARGCRRPTGTSLEGGGDPPPDRRAGVVEEDARPPRIGSIAAGAARTASHRDPAAGRNAGSETLGLAAIGFASSISVASAVGVCRFGALLGGDFGTCVRSARSREIREGVRPGAFRACRAFSRGILRFARGRFAPLLAASPAPAGHGPTTRASRSRGSAATGLRQTRPAAYGTSTGDGGESPGRP
jgi:hypothetical protein